MGNIFRENSIPRLNLVDTQSYMRRAKRRFLYLCCFVCTAQGYIRLRLFICVSSSRTVRQNKFRKVQALGAKDLCCVCRCAHRTKYINVILKCSFPNALGYLGFRKEISQIVITCFDKRILSLQHLIV